MAFLSQFVFVHGLLNTYLLILSTLHSCTQQQSTFVGNYHSCSPQLYFRSNDSET